MCVSVCTCTLQIGTLTSGMTTRRYWVVLRKETPRCDQLSRLQLYRDEFQASVAPSREIILDSIKMIHHADQRRKKAFEVQLASESLMFQCGSHADVDDWIGDIRRFRDSLRSSSFSASFPDNSLGQQLYEGMLSVCALSIAKSISPCREEQIGFLFEWDQPLSEMDCTARSDEHKLLPLYCLPFTITF